MNTRLDNLPGIPYEGDLPYAFVSYRHNEWESVYPLVRKLIENGYRIWYDEGIDGGSGWRSSIQEHVENCSVFIPFLSAAFCESSVCRAELSMACDDGTLIIPIFLDDAKLTNGVRTAIADRQGIFTLDSSKIDETYQRLTKMKAFRDAKVGADVAESSPIQKQYEHESSFAKKNDNPRLASFEDLIALGYTAYEIAERLVENDKRLYPKIGEENEGEASVWAEYLSSYPDTFRYIIDENNNIVGNWSFLAVSEEEHGELLRSGALLESSFSVDNTDFLFFEGEYIGYLLNLSLNEGFATPANYQLLFDSFSEQMLTFAERGIFFKEWYVNVFRRDHAAMYKRMGFRHLCKNKVVGDLYAADVSSLSKGKLFATNTRLCELYEAHFE